jgi:hypothetical protein
MQQITEVRAKAEDFSKIRDLNADAAMIVDYFSKRERQARTTHLMRFHADLEREYNCRINWENLVATFRDGYSAVGAGSLVTGKTPENHRFEWGLSLVDVAKCVKGELSPESIKAAPSGKTRVVYPVGYTPKRGKNPNGVRAKRKGKTGRIKGGKNNPQIMEKRAKEKAFAHSLAPVARVQAIPAAGRGPGIEVMVIEGNQIKRYEVPADKSQGFMTTVLPAFAVAK